MKRNNNKKYLCSFNQIFIFWRAFIYIFPFASKHVIIAIFIFSTSLRQKDEMVQAILKEIGLQKNYLENEPIETIYFGGGTPSLLNRNEFDLILEKINQTHTVVADAEITLEANPDDLSLEKLKDLSDSPINRLSIGIQSFSEADLKFMNRAHNSREGFDAIENAKKVGFQNLTIDLIYGTPTMSDEQWEENINQTFKFEIPHISCYCLTVEPNTALDHFVKNKKAPPVDEERAARQFEHLIERTKNEGYDHYEISNFAKKGCYSRHNSAYWLGVKYLGIGPAAHSFNGNSRQWNVANNSKYIHSLSEGNLIFEKEMLSPEMHYNEYVMTALRTIWGVDLEKIPEVFQSHFLKEIQPFLKNETARRKGNIFTLTEKGKFLADGIAAEVFI